MGKRPQPSVAARWKQQRSRGDCREDCAEGGFGSEVEDDDAALALFGLFAALRHRGGQRELEVRLLVAPALFLFALANLLDYERWEHRTLLVRQRRGGF